MAATHIPTPSSQTGSNAAALTAATAAGGFSVRPSLPSPAPSTASSRAAARLPRPRSKPLLPGSRKEDYARDYVSQRMMHISRRWVKKHAIPDPADIVKGYESMDEVCADMEEVVDVLWFSGTPSIQVPTLLALALALNEYLPSFPPSPRPTFSLLQKLDHCFASLLVGRDVKTNEALAGFQKRGLSAGFSKTDMVRIKSLADETRMLVAVVMSGEADVEDVEDEDELESKAGQRAEKAAGQSRDGPGRTIANDDDDDDDDELEITELASPVTATATIKPEQIDDADSSFSEDEEEAQEFIDVEPPTNKRKLSQRLQQRHDVDTPSAADALDQHLADETRKRIKMEDPDHVDSGGMASISEPPRNAISMGANGANGVKTEMEDEAMSDTLHTTEGPAPDHQFHWTVEDSDSDSDQERSSGQEQPPMQAQVTLSQRPSQPRTRFNGMDEEDEEEEELHLNVAKVYGKTLTQLGETLGESIIDEQ